MLHDALLEQLIQTIATTIWQRPELETLRKPIEEALHSRSFRDLTLTAFRELETDDLPHLLDEGFIQMPAVQQALADYIVRGEEADIDRLADLYADRFLKPSDAPDIRPQLATYLQKLRETFANDPSYSGMLLARGQTEMLDALQRFRREIHDQLGTMQADNLRHFREVLQKLDQIFTEPEIQQLVQRRQGTHVFLSYSTKNADTARTVRNALEGAGHTVWQDTTAIKGGHEWIQSIANGVRRSYAMVTLVSKPANQSRSSDSLFGIS